MNDWADESEYLHPNSKGYVKPINDINDHEQPDRMVLLMTKLDAVSIQLGRLHEDLQFTNERVSTMESLLKIYSTSPKQAAIINTQPTDKNLHLKRNLQANVNKLNEAFKVVDIIQHLMINAGQLHDSHLPNRPNSLHTLNIITHSILSFKDTVKQQLLMNLYEQYNANIIALQDIKLTYSTVRALKLTLDKSYTILTNTQLDSNEYNTRVALIFKKYIADHIFNHGSFWGRIIYTDIQLQNKYCIPMQVIFVGDLNAKPRRHINPKHSNQFFRNLANYNLFNIGDICYDNANTRLPTFHRNSCNPSRIDHIYCSTELATQTIGLSSTPTDLSDHYLLIATLEYLEL
ncbi:7835_t:CDS:2, partial [Funneliformis geosporum]